MANPWEVAKQGANEPRGWFRRFLHVAWEEKAWWIVPMVVTLATLFGLVLVASRQQVAPFFYAVNG